VGWAKEVILPANFDYGLAEGPREVPSWWEAKGVRRADGLPWTAADAASPAGLILPAGAFGPAFLALPNHFAIRKYNNSTSYALGIGLLADRFGGGGALVTAWPVEAPLSLSDRMAAQIALVAPGLRSRRARRRDRRRHPQGPARLAAEPKPAGGWVSVDGHGPAAEGSGGVELS
jgi:membrane-bound lytic murein transglycosylase B